MRVVRNVSRKQVRRHLGHSRESHAKGAGTDHRNGNHGDVLVRPFFQ